MSESLELDNLPLDYRQSAAYAQWTRLSKDGKTPLRQDFKPERMFAALPTSMLLHVEPTDQGLRFRQRLEGRFAALAFGQGTNRMIEEIYTDEHLFEILPRYLECAMTGDPAMTQATVDTTDGDPFTYTRLVLPFAAEDGSVNRLFVVFGFEASALARLSCPVNVRRNQRTIPEQREMRPFGVVARSA